MENKLVQDKIYELGVPFKESKSSINYCRDLLQWINLYGMIKRSFQVRKSLISLKLQRILLQCFNTVKKNICLNWISNIQHKNKIKWIAISPSDFRQFQTCHFNLNSPPKTNLSFQAQPQPQPQLLSKYITYFLCSLNLAPFDHHALFISKIWLFYCR